MSVYGGPEMPDSNLYMYIDFANSKSYPGTGTTIYDLSGNGRNGTLVNSPTFTNSSGGSATFGSTKYIDFSTSGHSLANTNFTVEVVARTSTNPNSYQDLFTIQANSNTAADSIGFYKARSGIISGSYYGGLWTSGGTNNYALTTYTGSDIAAAGWIHLVLTVELSGTYVPKIYWNGTLNSTGSSNISSFNFSTINYFRVADGGYYSGENFLGDIAYVKFYTRALTAAEVTQSYSAFRQRFSTPAEVKAGLILDLDAGNTSSYSGSGSTWTDLSGSGYNATLYNGPTFNSGNGGSIVFDGSNDYAQTANLTSVVSEKTLAAWCQLGSTTQSGGGLIGVMSTDGSIFDTIVYNETGQGWGFGSNNFFRTAWSGVSESSTSAWVYLAATYSNNLYKLYRNGVLILTTTAYSLYTFNIGINFIVGKRHSTVTGPLNAKIAKATVYNRALSALEIGTNFDALRGRFGL